MNYFMYHLEFDMWAAIDEIALIGVETARKEGAYHPRKLRDIEAMLDTITRYAEAQKQHYAQREKERQREAHPTRAERDHRGAQDDATGFTQL